MIYHVTSVDDTAHQNFDHVPQQSFLHHCCCTNPFWMARDPQHVVGNVVEAKACHVINMTGCAQWYGANKTTKMVQGIVTAVDVIQNANNNQLTTFITMAYDLGGIMIKLARLNVWYLHQPHMAQQLDHLMGIPLWWTIQCPSTPPQQLTHLHWMKCSQACNIGGDSTSCTAATDPK